jgi:hypothetical protein
VRLEQHPHRAHGLPQRGHREPGASRIIPAEGKDLAQCRPPI